MFPETTERRVEIPSLETYWAEELSPSRRQKVVSWSDPVTPVMESKEARLGTWVKRYLQWSSAYKCWIFFFSPKIGSYRCFWRRILQFGPTEHRACNYRVIARGPRGVNTWLWGKIRISWKNIHPWSPVYSFSNWSKFTQKKTTFIQLTCGCRHFPIATIVFFSINLLT